MYVQEIKPKDSEAYYKLRIISEQEYLQFVGFKAERELVAGPEGIKEILHNYPSEGAAKLLMDTKIEWVQDHPEIMALSLQVTLSNTRGQAFYKKYGFSVFGTEQNSLFAAGEYHGVHYMELCTNHASDDKRTPTLFIG